MTAPQSQLIVIGRISGVFGVHGWVRIFSYTNPKENILLYTPWQICVDNAWKSIDIVEGRSHGKGIVAHLLGYDDRDSVMSLIDTDIAVHRDRLPAAAKGEYYWADLIGMSVVTVDGIGLGRVDHLMETGANDVLVVKNDKERLIPFVPDKVVIDVDTENRTIKVNWDPDF